MSLLSDLSDDLGFGIEGLLTREEHEHLQEQLLQARKMEAVGQLSGGIAHDFNNMLSSILGYAGLALDRPSNFDQSVLDEYLREVINAGERARDLIGQMLSFSRSHQRTAERVELLPIISEAIKMLRFTLPASIELTVDTGDQSLAVNIDPVQLQQIVMNLSINARDAMHNKGRLHICVREVTVSTTEKLGCQSCREMISAGDYIELSIEDSGDGISQALLDRVFDPFFTTKEVGKGTGMGLSVVHGIVHEMGGHILVDSVANKGTIFRLFLPPAVETEKQALAVIGRTDELPAATRTARILVVDDELSVAGFLKELLTMSGYDVLLAHDGEEALAVYRAQQGQIDLVITDQTMPKLTGAELATQLLADAPKLPIILCTGYSEDVDEARAQLLGIQGYMIKPVPSRVLLGKIAELLEGGG